MTVDDVIAVYLESADAGRPIGRAELLARYPQFTKELRCFFADDQRLGDLANSFRGLVGISDRNDCARQRLASNVAEQPDEQLEDTGSSLPRCGNYELIEEIARGGMGVVYKARQVCLNRLVALKMILAGQLADPQDVERFRAEARAAAALQHPNIVAIYEVGESEGQHYYAMEFVPGDSLANLVRENPLPAKQAAAVVATLARAVHYAHLNGVVHRDLKPSNVLLCDAESIVSEKVPPACRLERTIGSPKITDFGLAKRHDGSQVTMSGDIVGTPSYMSPEQAASRRNEVGPRSDVYSLGAIFYELITGRPPFRAESPVETLVQVLESEPVSPRLLNPNIPRDAETISLTCLQKDPSRRYATAQDLADDLMQFCNGEPIRARAIGRLERCWCWCRRRPGWAAMLAVSALAALTITGGSLWFSAQLHAELQRTDAKQRELQIALARQVAERLDSDLRQLAGVPSTLARLLSERSDWSIDQIDKSLRELLDADPRLFGMCVAFEPYQFEPGREHFARYACRHVDSSIELKFLDPPQYRLYREWDWYRLPAFDGASHWSEPFIDTGGGDIPMVTFSAPFQRDGAFAGVVTADLSLEYFRQLKRWLDELQLARGDYGFVISPAGTFISDANPGYQMGRRISEFARPELDSGFTSLLQMIESKQPGSVRGIDFWTGSPVTFLVAPVTSSGWSFVAVIPD